MKSIPAALLLLLSLQASQALACSCMIPGPPASEAARAGAVFLGEATAVRDPQPADTWWTRLVWRLGLGPDPTTISSMREIHYTFRVLERFKGASERSIEVVSAAGSESCGYSFQPDKQYVVYAYRASDSRLMTGLCSLTGPAGDPRSGLQWLRATRARIATKAHVPFGR